MSKLKLQIQLDTDFEVDLSQFDFELMNENQIKKELIKYYFDEIGFGEIEISNVEDNSIVDAVQQEIYNHQVLFYAVSYTHLRAHETQANLVCRLLLEQK